MILPPASEGTMVYDSKVLRAYELAKNLAGETGRVATMQDIAYAKAGADSSDPIWTQYVGSTSGEFYGVSKTGIPIVVVVHGIDGILQNPEIMQRPRIDSPDGRKLQLTGQEFRMLEEGHYGKPIILERDRINKMREFPTSVLSYSVALEEPLLRARLGNGTEALLLRHLHITRAESRNDFVITNDHQYPYMEDSKYENTGGIIVMNGLADARRCGGEPSSVSSDIHVATLSGGNRFIAVHGKNRLGSVNNKLQDILHNLPTHWQKLAVPNTLEQPPLPYTLKTVGDSLFTQYRDEGDCMDSGQPMCRVVEARKVGSVRVFKTPILGYYGFFKYELDEVRKGMPAGANAYLMGEPEIVSKGGNPVRHKAPIQFFNVDVDKSRRVLRSDEIGQDLGLIRKLIA